LSGWAEGAFPFGPFLLVSTGNYRHYELEFRLKIEWSQFS
jgi:hypothetical protein